MSFAESQPVKRKKDSLLEYVFWGEERMTEFKDALNVLVNKLKPLNNRYGILLSQRTRATGQIAEWNRIDAEMKSVDAEMTALVESFTDEQVYDLIPETAVDAVVEAFKSIDAYEDKSFKWLKIILFRMINFPAEVIAPYVLLAKSDQPKVEQDS